MRKLLLILVATCAIAACKKSSVTPATSGLFGRWELSRTSGGLRPDSVYTAGNGHIYQFYSDSTYKKYTASTLSAQGTFHVVNNLGPNENGIILIYFDHNTTGEPFQFTGLTFSIGSSAADGIESYYQKISN